MATVRQMVETITNAESANKVSADIQTLQHASTSKKESAKMLNDKAKSLGLRYSASAKGYIKDQKEG